MRSPLVRSVSIGIWTAAVRVLVAACFLWAMPASAQLIQWGVKAGVPATDYFDAVAAPFNALGRVSYTSNTNRYTVGPTIEVSIPFHLGIEMDALYKRYHFTGTTFGVDTIAQEKTTANSWEFPILLKYKSTIPVIHPFVDAGISLHRLADVTQVISRRIFPSPTQFVTTTDTPPELNHRFNAGFVLGAGMAVRVSAIHISPEIRYTRWGSENFRAPTGDLDSAQNQVEFLVGLTF